MKEDKQNLQYDHFIDLLSELVLKYHLLAEKEDKTVLVHDSKSNENVDS